MLPIVPPASRQAGGSMGRRTWSQRAVVRAGASRGPAAGGGSLRGGVAEGDEGVGEGEAVQAEGGGGRRVKSRGTGPDGRGVGVGRAEDVVAQEGTPEVEGDPEGGEGEGGEEEDAAEHLPG